MHKIILMMLLAVVSSSTMASQWVLIQRNERNTVRKFIDISSIKNNGNFAEMVLLDSDQYENQATANKKIVEFDCKEKKQRALHQTIYLDAMGEGPVESEVPSRNSTFDTTPAGTYLELAWKFACGLKGLADTDSPKEKKFSWDSWMEATGNKAKITPQIAPSAVKTTGSAPARTEEVINACRHLVDDTGPGRPGIGSIYEIRYLAPIDASAVYGNMGPQGKLIPLILSAKFRDGENLSANGYIQKDAFGNFKCIKAN